MAAEVTSSQTDTLTYVVVCLSLLLKRVLEIVPVFRAFVGDIRDEVSKDLNRSACVPSTLFRVGFVVCREPGRISLYVALPPSRPEPIGSRKQLEPRSRSAVHRDENFAS